MAKTILKEIKGEELDKYLGNMLREIKGEELNEIVEKEFRDIPGEESGKCFIDVDCDSTYVNTMTISRSHNGNSNSRIEGVKFYGVRSVRKVRIDDSLEEDKTTTLKSIERKKPESKSKSKFSFWSLFRKK